MSLTSQNIDQDKARILVCLEELDSALDAYRVEFPIQEAGPKSELPADKILRELTAAFKSNIGADDLRRLIGAFLRITMGYENIILGLENAHFVPSGFAASLYSQMCNLTNKLTEYR